MDSFCGKYLFDTDIIVWNGIISKWGSIKKFVIDGDIISFAARQDLTKYLDAQK